MALRQRETNARNVRLCYPYWQYTNLFIFRFVSLPVYVYRLCMLYAVQGQTACFKPVESFIRKTGSLFCQCFECCYSKTITFSCVKQCNELTTYFLTELQDRFEKLMTWDDTGCFQFVDLSTVFNQTACLCNLSFARDTDNSKFSAECMDSVSLLICIVLNNFHATITSLTAQVTNPLHSTF